jgi:hypothetical protein
MARRSIWTRAKPCVGRERPHFLADDPPKSSVGSLPPSQAPRANAYCVVALGSSESLSDNMSDILYEQERRSQLSILKAPPKQPKNRHRPTPCRRIANATKAKIRNTMHVTSFQTCAQWKWKAGFTACRSYARVRSVRSCPTYWSWMN